MRMGAGIFPVPFLVAKAEKNDKVIKVIKEFKGE